MNIPDNNLDAYDTSVKDIAGVKDINIIFNVFNAYFDNMDSEKGLVSDRNELGVRTEKTRTKVLWAINKTVLKFKNKDHSDLIQAIFREYVPYEDKIFAFLWHFSLNNRLFREITVNVFAKLYFSGRATVSQNDIIAYIKENPSSPMWSDSTIYRLATKYLSLMTKFNLVSSGRVKSFKYIRPSSEAQVLFLYFAKLFSPNTSNILANELLPSSFISSKDIQERLKKLSMKGFFDMNFNGVTLNIELTHSYKGICDVLYNRS